MPDSSHDQRAMSEEFVRQGSMKRRSFWSDYLFLLRTNKKWWMLPLIVVLLAFGALMILAGTGAAPFIYTLF